jgi:hypothetical protein
MSDTRTAISSSSRRRPGSSGVIARWSRKRLSPFAKIDNQSHWIPACAGMTMKNRGYGQLSEVALTKTRSGAHA